MTPYNSMQSIVQIENLSNPLLGWWGDFSVVWIVRRCTFITSPAQIKNFKKFTSPTELGLGLGIWLD